MNGAPSVLRRFAFLLIAVGCLALGCTAYVLVDAALYQEIQRTHFEETRRESASSRSIGPPDHESVRSSLHESAPTEGGTIGEIDIPRLGIAAMVVQGESPAVLRRAVGHVADTALPGEAGNVVLAGHRDTFFRPLQHVRAGDTITLKTRSGDFDYAVEAVGVVPPTAVGVLEPTAQRTLTLITCYPFSYVGAAPNRFIVQARETSGLAQNTKGRG